ncbi:MAG: hypothetical protein NXH81_12620 [Halieaceae bacterium]|uniref:hypothetical protein n=1 Tax=Haliea alexandrii TaxID=2448162 RepID=UPI000F0B58A4|nr:hypothetical protein [Haliea alexandrii]MCR9186234.1 hypothetical protein [Halieaceae bacterium]
METPQQRKIREALNRPSPNDSSAKEKSDPETSTSLQAHALEHTNPDYVPKTLTPHEWEAWYAEHGVPASHRQTPKTTPAAQSLWSRLKNLFRRS